MENYASKKDSVDFLISLGFTLVDPEYMIFDSPGVHHDDLPVVQVFIYKCNHGYYCVDVNYGGHRAPCIWKGPKAEWDKSDESADFIKWLDDNHPGWR